MATSNTPSKPIPKSESGAVTGTSVATENDGKGQNLPSVQLALNGKPVYLMEFMASVKVVRDDQDMSGQDSGTAKADKGVKAKELSVTGMIPFRRAEWLTELFQLAEATDKKGEQVVYRIANMSAKAVNMREGVFSGEVTAEEQRVQGWYVSFKLVEQNSVAEKKAKSKDKPKTKTQSEKDKEKTKAGKPKKEKEKAKKAKATKAKKSGGKAKKSSSSDAGFMVFTD